MINRTQIVTAKSFFQRLRSDIAGNTLAMVAAGLVPMAGIIGSGVDLSRAYMVKTRLQQACDAGVLAGRRAMGDGAYNSNAQSQTNNFFNANFPIDYLDTTDRVFTPMGSSTSSSVTAVASVTLPTVVMKMFGNDDIKVAVDCKAVLEIANSDITMVLDSTGSMTYSIDDGSGGTTTRIAALRASMKSFYDIIDAAASGTGSRIRYSMVPYTGTANVGNLLVDLNSDYMISGTYPYESRQFVWEIDGPSGINVTNTSVETFETLGSVDGPECTDQYSQNQSVPGWWTASPSGNPVTSSSSSTSGGTTTTVDTVKTYSYYSWDGSTSAPPGYAVGSSYWRTCVRRVITDTTTTTDGPTRIETTTWESGATYLRTEYTEVDHNVDDYIASRNGGTPADNPADRYSDTSSWAGCIEERNTVDSDSVVYNGSSGTITPGGTDDLDIDLVPNNDNRRWRPYWPDVMYYRNAGTTLTSSGTASQTSCPQPAQLLTEMTETEFDNYADALTADGGTYHDIGMIWGARLSSPTGLFSANVTQAASNNGYVSRHLIFMTDGVLDIGDTYYSAYGLERHDLKVGTGDETQASTNHTARFQAVCEATKAKGIRVWVIAFATSLTTEMSNCASSNSAFVSTNAASLNSTFTTIAQTVADLRLSQ